jgi:hypothetical protein
MQDFVEEIDELEIPGTDLDSTMDWYIKLFSGVHFADNLA